MKLISETKIKRFIYDSFEERDSHVEEMKREGYIVANQLLKKFSYSGDSFIYGEFFKNKEKPVDRNKI